MRITPKIKHEWGYKGIQKQEEEDIWARCENRTLYPCLALESQFYEVENESWNMGWNRVVYLQMDQNPELESSKPILNQPLN